MAARNLRVSYILDAKEDDFAQALNHYIASVTSSRQATHEPQISRPSPPLARSPYAWRMHHPEQPKYQLFPRETCPLPSPSPGRSFDAEHGFAVAVEQQKAEKVTEKTSIGSGLKLRLKEHGLIRRRKISVPELGPMTTVQETSMDSPTIPGYVASRPPLHDRAVSAPGYNFSKPSHLTDRVMWSKDQSVDEKSELVVNTEAAKQVPSHTRRPLSPSTLTPLVIPRRGSPKPLPPTIMSRVRPGFHVEGRTARPLGSPSTAGLGTPISTPKTAGLPSLPTLHTPTSAPTEMRRSPNPWDTFGNTKKKDDSADAALDRSGSALGHRKTQSDTGSIMERGRPRKRNEASPGKLGRVDSVRDMSEARRAFEQLPKGCKASDAVNVLGWDEAAALQRQALQQAVRFEVLRKEDVDRLSQELRQLDERTEYLRRTYASLRAGRRNLQVRICAYLRSPRTAKFHEDSMLKQEEALAELDASIDDWANKLDKAQNRRTRVRQKLLEHVAAAVLMPGLGNTLGPGDNLVGAGEGLQVALAGSANDVSTPPRSPTKSVSSQHAIMSSPSPSPRRSAATAHVPSTIFEQPVSDEEHETDLEAASPPAVPPKESNGLPRAETIRIYAADDVYALLADVEREITKMGRGADFEQDSPKQVYRTRSDGVLTQGDLPSPTQKLAGRKRNNSESDGSVTSSGEASSSSNNASSTSLSSTWSSSSSSSPADSEMFLTSAVFRPAKSATRLAV